MGRRRKPRINDIVTFEFAGTLEKGKITEITGKGKTLRYYVDDGKYKYPTTFEAIQSIN